MDNIAVKIIRYSRMMREDDGRNKHVGLKGKEKGGRKGEMDGRRKRRRGRRGEKNKERRRRGLFCVAEPSCFEIASINLAPVYGQQYINKKNQPARGTQDLQILGKWLFVRFMKQSITGFE